MEKRENDDIVRNLLFVLEELEQARENISWVAVSSATSSLRDAMEEIPFRKPLPWE